MTVKAYNFEKAYYNVTGMWASEDIQAYKKFFNILMSNNLLGIPKFSSNNTFLWTIIKDNSAHISSWYYNDEDYEESDAAYDNALEEYDAEEVKIPSGIIKLCLVNEVIGVII